MISAANRIANFVPFAILLVRSFLHRNEPGASGKVDPRRCVAKMLYKPTSRLSNTHTMPNSKNANHSRVPK
jgi:hypothetical protein